MCGSAELCRTLCLYEQCKSFSLDMWRSSTHGRHWSFGITFVRGNDMVFDVIEKHCSRKWKDKYGEYVVHYNLDWYLNYLKENKYLSVETFYIENCMFFTAVTPIM